MRRRYRDSKHWCVSYLVCLCSRTSWIENCSVHFDVTDIKELVIFEPVRTASFDVWLHVVKLAEASCEVEVSLVCEVRVTEDSNAVL